MLLNSKSFLTQDTEVSIPQFGVFALENDDILYKVTDENYTPCLNIVKAINYTTPTQSINNVITANSIVEGLLAISPMAEGRYANIIYRMPSIFDEDIKDTSYQNSYFMTEATNVMRICKDLLTREGTLHLQVSEDFIAQAKLIGQEVFGKSNYVTTFIVNGNKAGNCKNGVGIQHYYVLVFAKDRSAALGKYGYKIGNSLQFCNEDSTKKAIANVETVITTTNNEYPYEDNVSPFTLNSYMRSDTKNHNGDKSFFPIYYLPNMDAGKVDLNPYLFLENPNYPGIVELWPTGDNGIQYKWNGIKATVSRMIESKNFCVNNLGGNYRLLYKSRPNYNESGFEVQPVKSILEDNYSNMSITNLMQKITMMKDKYFGFNPNLLNTILGAFSREGEDVLFIGDDYLTGLASVNVHQIDRNYTVVQANVDRCELTISAISTENEMQIILYNTINKSQQDILSFVEDFDLYKPTALFKYNCASTYVDNENYTVRQTPDGDLILIFKKRYDITVYEEASKFIKSILADNIDKCCIIQYKSDDNVFLGANHFEGINILTENIQLKILSVQARLYRSLYTKFTG